MKSCYGCLSPTGTRLMTAILTSYLHLATMIAKDTLAAIGLHLKIPSVLADIQAQEVGRLMTVGLEITIAAKRTVWTPYESGTPIRCLVKCVGLLTPVGVWPWPLWNVGALRQRPLSRSDRLIREEEFSTSEDCYLGKIEVQRLQCRRGAEIIESSILKAFF